MLRRLFTVAAWGLAAYIVFVTLSPIGLRPKTGHPDLERFAAFFVLGGLFVLAYPKRVGLIAAGVAVAALVLEASQILASTRDARLHDAVMKAAGGVLGAAVAAIGESARVKLSPNRG